MSDENKAVQVFGCGPSSPRCVCLCPDGECGHQWDGPWWESEDGTAASVTCSVCARTRMSHDMWVGP